MCNNDIYAKYEKLKSEFEEYQNFSQNTIQILNDKNLKLEKKLDSLANIVEVSKYINSNLNDENFIQMINDMIIGILGVNFSSIFLLEKDKLEIKATNLVSNFNWELKKVYFDQLECGKPFIINCKLPIFPNNNEEFDIHSLVGVPIYIRNKFNGYIVVEHTLYNFFNYEHIKFISAIANQVGIALENNFLYNKVKENSIKDPLLDIYNRRYFLDVIDEKIKKKPKSEFGIVMVDIDNFKKVNDVYGHQLGDEVLIQTVGVIKANIDEEDMVGRYGGEEILIYIHDVKNKKAVFKKVDNIRMRIENNTVNYNNLKTKVTASFGISYYPFSGFTIEELIKVADVMMYSAKKSGKNKVVTA